MSAFANFGSFWYRFPFSGTGFLFLQISGERFPLTLFFYMFVTFCLVEMLLLEDNYISGSSSGTFCVGPDNATRPFGLDMFQADCYSNGVTPPKFECPCCTECCDAPDNYCTEKLQAYKETWESTYDRNFFYFRDDETDLDYLAN